MASREIRMRDATGNRKAQEEGSHCLGSGCPPRPPLPPQSRTWDRCGSTWATWSSGQGGMGQGPCSVVDHSGSGPSGSTWAIIRPLLGLAAPWLCPERCSLPRQSQLRGTGVCMNILWPCPGELPSRHDYVRDTGPLPPHIAHSLSTNGMTRPVSDAAASELKDALLALVAFAV